MGAVAKIVPKRHESQVLCDGCETVHSESIHCGILSSYFRQVSLRAHCTSYYANKISISVHVADTYLHIATEAVNLVQIHSQTPDQHQYGRAIDPWCFDNHKTMGTKQNKNFWGCAMTWSSPANGADETVMFNNRSNLMAVFDEGYGKFIMNFTDETGTRYAVVGPRTTPSDIDWQATSFAISSQCTPMPWTACIVDTKSDKMNDWGSRDTPFTCSLARGSPIDFSGTYQSDRHSYSFSDFHKYLQEDDEAFLSTGLKMRVPGDTVASVATNCTEQDLTEMFPSTWRWTAVADIGRETTIPEDMIDIAWPLLLGTAMVVSCNSTGKFRLPIPPVIRIKVELIRQNST